MASEPMSRTVAYAATDEELFREQMRSSAQGDGAHPRTFGYLLSKAAEMRVWERLRDPGGAPFRSFRDFLVAPDPYGLGMTVDELRHAVALAGDGALQAVERLLKGEIRTPTASPGRPNRNDSTTIIMPERGATTANTVARLKRDDPALAEKVVNGEMSAYQAARSKGWKPPRIQVTTPERTATHLRKHMDPEQLRELALLLTTQENE